MILNKPKHRKTLSSFLLFLPILSSSLLMAQSNELTFEQEFNIGNDTNFFRTKDADIGDINADGWPDILDANSQNGLTIRFNNGGTNFIALIATGVPINPTTYDADLVDLNRDGYPDLIRTESDNRANSRTASISVYRNLQGNGPLGRNWFDLNTPSDTASLNECPDDIDFGDFNGDGWIDFAVARRLRNCVTGPNRSSGVSVYLNTSSENSNGDISFELIADLVSPEPGASIHDVVVVNSSNNNNPYIVALNESGRNFTSLNRFALGESENIFTTVRSNTSTFGSNSLTAVAGDLNLDGLDDLVTTDTIARTITFYESSSSAFGNFLDGGTTRSRTIETPEFRAIYDLELGDYDLNGYLDILISGFSNDINNQPHSLILLNKPVRSNSRILTRPRGNPVQRRVTAGVRSNFVRSPISAFPNQPTQDQILSGDALDYDLDGDLDIYIAGGDGRIANGCFGCVRNRLYRNTTSINPIYTNFETGLEAWEQGQSDGTATHDWSINTGSTSSQGTGPARAKSGSSYLYFETSAGGANAEGNTAFLESEIIQSDLRDRHTLSFDYHMFGDNIGSLHVDLLRGDNGSSLFDDVLLIEGSQQSDENDEWRNVTLDLSNFTNLTGRSFIVRIRAVAAGGFRGDIAIDNLIITTSDDF